MLLTSHYFLGVKAVTSSLNPESRMSQLPYVSAKYFRYKVSFKSSAVVALFKMAESANSKLNVKMSFF